MNQEEETDTNSRLEKLIPEGLKFKCSKCGLERYGNDKKECEHLYMDYNDVVK